ncbi:ribosomal L7Ae/L30e/S12e/Gadd45 family protein [uncultured Anaerotruncus sp.]|uniref:L7Ae/L30e/S12e/Gadd45 family ribosomal protein n=1 Tax=uncultured Anaerotruncus sp. TaxID=905011 RepID=UPI00280B008B|nr:ribosomal L7Ae/L30e/S12e/Gadd45 family protein [uncultured Anaerotruncus sp.]
MNDRLLSALSLCRKAGRLKMGGDVVREEILKGGARLVLLASDAAERTVRQMRFACEEGEVPLRMLPRTMDELWATAGKRYGVFAVCDGGFAKMIAGLLPPEGTGTAEQ